MSSRDAPASTIACGASGPTSSTSCRRGRPPPSCPGGRRTPPPAGLSATLYDPRMGDLMAALKQRFDFVVVDTPPVLPLADVPTLSRDLDGAVMVVRAGTTPAELIDSAIGALYGVGGHGMVLNAVEPRVAAMLRIMPYTGGSNGESQKARPAKR